MLPKIEPGIINLWSGSIANVPSGWVLCDGNNGTPDLTDQFVVAAGTTYLQGVQSGGLSHYHEFTSDNHQHTLQTAPPDAVGAGTQVRALTNPGALVGDTDSTNVLPVWYSIAYIMKT